MAFVSGLPITGRHTAALSRSALAGTSVTSASTPVCTGPRMGYGDYSYLTDKTKGHVQQYYVDKFRIASDFVKGPPKTDGDAKLGRTIKGGVQVPIQGVPQVMDPALPTSMERMVDPRLAEADGSVYPWDVNYQDPQFAADTYADLDDESVADQAFAQFRGSLSAERGEALTAMDFGAEAKVQQIKAGLDEDYLLCLDGALDANYARLQKIADPPGFTPTGEPQTEIPGFPYLGSVGALDLQKKPGESTVFWKEEDKVLPYKRPSGANTPELPYSTSPTVEQLKEAQVARGLLPSQD